VLGIRTDPPLPHIAAETIADTRGPFANTRLANAGRDKGVAEGNPVISEHGLVGRIVGVSDHVSRVLLLTDAESRTPVLVVRTNGRAILSGDGGAAPKLDYIRSALGIKEGDRVLTSGDGGVFPRGLPVGTVVRGLDGGWHVALDSDAAPIDFVQILLFSDFSQLADAQALAPKELPTAMTEEPSASIAPTTSAPVPLKPATAKAVTTKVAPPKVPTPKVAPVAKAGAAAKVAAPPATPKPAAVKAATTSAAMAAKKATAKLMAVTLAKQASIKAGKPAAAKPPPAHHPAAPAPAPAPQSDVPL
jgi:rod shape-determining protein MreC